MARSHRTSGPPIQLFPFLDVFICTIGSLIVMLMVVSMKVRENTIARAVAESQEAVVVETTPIAPLELPTVEAQPIPPVPSEEKLEELAAAKRRLEELDQRARQLDRTVRERQVALASLHEQSQDVEAKARSTVAAERALKQRILDASKAQDIAANELGQLRDEQTRLRHSISESQRLLASHKRQGGNSDYVIVPYDGVTGTTRRPLILECTDTGIRFAAENIELSATDLQYFTPEDNPVLAGVRELVRFWTSYNNVQDKPQQQPKPYVLLIVRPSGTLGYYVARSFLDELETEFGYELVSETFSFEVPPTEARATELCKAAVEAALKRRQRPITRQQDSFSQALGEDLKSQTLPNSPGGNSSAGASTAPKGTFSSITDSGRRIEKFDSRTVTRGGGTGSQRFFASDAFQSHRTRVESGSTGQLGSGQPGSGQISSGANEPARSFEFSDDAPPVLNTPRQGAAPGSANSGNASRGPSGSASGSTTGSAAGGAAGSAIAKRQAPQRASDSESEFTAKEAAVLDLKPPARDDRAVTKGSSLAAPRQQELKEETLEEQVEKPTLMKDREIKNMRSFKRQWGVHNPKGSIALEKEMTLRVSERAIVIADRFKVSRGEDRTNGEITDLTMQAMDVVARDWGKPPEQFYWVPSVELVIEAGGDLMAEPMKKALEQAGVGVKVRFE